ncbi:MAG: GNVR domain-containing protein [Rhodothermales bacterium]
MGYSETGMTVRALLTVMWRGRWLFIAVVFSTLLLAAAYVALSPKVFRAESTLIVERDDSADQLRGIAFGRGDQDVLVEVEVLKSMDLATRVADELMRYRIGESPEVYPLLDRFSSSAADRLRLARALRKNIEVEQVRRDIGVIELGFRSREPKEAQLVTNLYASQYAARNLESRRVHASGLRTFVEGQLREHQDRLNEVESQLATFQESENAFALDEEARRLSVQMAELQTLLDQAHVENEMVNAQLASLNDEYAKLEPNLAARVSAAGLEKQIATLQEEIAQLEYEIEQKYAKNPTLHGRESTDPALVSLIAQSEGLKEQVRRKADRYIEGIMSSGGVDPERSRVDSPIPSTLAYISTLRRSITDKRIEAAALQARISVLSRRIASYQRDFDRIPARARTIAALQRDRGSSEQTYEWLAEKYEEAKIAEESEFGNVRILDTAYIPTEPVSPRPLRALVLGCLIGILLGCAAVGTRELLDDTVSGADDVRRYGFPVAGVVGSLRQQEARNVADDLPVIREPDSDFARQIQHIVTRLDAVESRTGVALLVTSPAVGEGKSCVAANIAAGLAASGNRTLLLDANVWRPRVHELVGARQEPGLSGLLFGSTLMKDAIQPTAVRNLFVIAAGASRDRQFTLLASRDFDALMTYLRTSFDRIVIDAPGVKAEGSSVGLTPLADRLLLVVEAGRTRHRDLAECVSELSEFDVAQILFAISGGASKRPLQLQQSVRLRNSTPSPSREPHDPSEVEIDPGDAGIAGSTRRRRMSVTKPARPPGRRSDVPQWEDSPE